jgi:hypothetical protein
MQETLQQENGFLAPPGVAPATRLATGIFAVCI